MPSRDSITKLSARISALRQAMDAVRRDTTPDHGKWGCAPSFARSHAEIAKEYGQLTGDRDVRFYDADKLRGWADTVWPQQKVIFDNVYYETLALVARIDQMKVPDRITHMYNLLIAGLDDSWNGKPLQIELSRCVREYTDPRIAARFEELNKADIAELKRFPCIFGYEVGCKQSPKYGYIRDITSRQGKARIEYEIVPVEPFLSASDLEELAFELDIGKLELYRTHWAVKEVNLGKELRARNIVIPSAALDVTNAVDVSLHTFDVALSFPGEVRELVGQIGAELERQLGPNRYFYDDNYKSQLARPELDTLLQGIYSRAKLDVVFLSSDYQAKNWCGIEFRAIREIIFAREHSRVMFVRTDDGVVNGVFKTDGYIDARTHTPARIAEFICERVRLNERAAPDL